MLEKRGGASFYRNVFTLKVTETKELIAGFFVGNEGIQQNRNNADNQRP